MKSVSFVRLLVFCLLIMVLVACGSDEPEEQEVTEQPTAAVEQVVESQPEAASVVRGQAVESETTVEAENDLSEESAPPPNATVLDIVMYDSFYGETDDNVTNPPLWQASSTKILLINVDNRGKEKHNWVIVKKDTEIPVPYEDEQNSDIILYNPGMVYAHSQTQLAINPLEPGEYAVICTVSGHYPFMQGRLVVSD